MLERIAVRIFFVLLLTFAFRMTWLAAYGQGRESIFEAQQIEATLNENCYSYDGDCSDHKTVKPKLKRGVK